MLRRAGIPARESVDAMITRIRAATVLGVAAATLAVAACQAGPSTPREPAPAAALAWGPCPDGDAGTGIECAPVEVPVDWSRPEGRTITLMVGRLPATGPGGAEGTVMVNLGGPIGISIDMMREYGGAAAFAGLRARMDVVTWDIRGGPGMPGLSTPLRCTWKALPLPDLPRDQAEFDALAAANHAAGQACREQDPELFDHMDSASHARDVDAIRAALGEERVNLYGASYGGFLAQAYARLFPERVRTIVLDGTWNHSAADWAGELEAGARINDTFFTRFFDWCAAESSCALHGRDAPALWRQLVEGADRSPIPVPGTDVRFDGRDLRSHGLGMARRGPSGWPALAAAVERAGDGDASGLVPPPPRPPYPAVPQPGVVECTDWPRPADHAELAVTLARLDAAAPFSGAAGTIFDSMTACVGWPAPVANPPRPLPPGLPPLLVAGAWGEFDAASRVAAQVPGSGYVAHDGPGHTLYQANDCARAHIDAYLADAVVPPPGTTC